MWSLCVLAALVTALTGARTESRHALPATIARTAAAAADRYNLTAAAPARRARSYTHLQGDSRRRKLYSHTRLFIRIDRTGTVTGTGSTDDVYTILEITSVDVGVVAIRSLTTGLYLAMNRGGEVYGEREYSVSCRLKERIEENGYNTYASARWRKRHREMFISLNTNGKPLRGRKTHRKNRNTHFLPITV